MTTVGGACTVRIAMSGFGDQADLSPAPQAAGLITSAALNRLLSWKISTL
jgi:hypothetical protein